MAAPVKYDVTILVNDVDVTQYVEYESMSLDDYARQVSTFRFTITNPSGVTPQRQHTVVVTADSLPDDPVIFIGYIFALKTRKRDNGITIEYECDCQDRKALLQRTVLGGNDFTGSDLTILGSLLTNAYPDLSDLFDFSTDVTSLMSSLDFTVEDGTNLLDALNDLADLAGAEPSFETVQNGAAVITFDTGTYADYTLDTGAGMSTGGETATGNPGNAYQGTSGAAAANQYIQIKITLSGATDVSEITFDAYVDVTGGTGAHTRILLRLAGSTIFNSNNVSNVTNDAAWHNLAATVDFLTNPGDDWTAPPYNCDEIWILLDPGGGAYSASDVRLDNIIVNPGEGEITTNLQWDANAPAADFNIDVQSGNQYAADIDFTIGSLDDFNSITVIGGYEEVTISKQLDNDGVRDHIGLPYPVKGLAVYKNTGTDTTPVWGSALALGAWGSDTLTGDGGTKDVLLDAEHNVLFFNTAPSNLVNSYKITGTIQRPIRVRVEDVATGDLTLATSHTDEKITSVDQAVAIGQAQLEQKNAMRQLSFKTNHPGLKPGQSITIADSARGLSELVTIRRISTTWQGPIGFFDVECGDDDENSVDAIIANNDKQSRASGVTTSPNTQTAYVLTSNNDPLTTDGQLLYTIG